ncbi:metallophosphoesterase [Solibacillus sp. FSL H8-0523]|uniref:metallophosphoesterase n=1 Tax=Solibacillus sp. FSL H8-0523 TaxID=2954511 RepID=UPI0031015715
MTIFFTADQHFFHKNVLTFEQRPFATVEEMNEALIQAWNRVVGYLDTVYVIGDFVFHKYANWVEILERLRGQIVLIRGNHDDNKVVKRLVNEGYFYDYHDVGVYLKVDGHQLWLSHYPMEIGLRPKKWSIHGHIHSVPSTWDNQINVGVDSPLLKSLPFGEPLSVEMLVEILNERTPSIEERFTLQRNKEENND